MSRLETISDTSGTLAAYKYLGLGTVAVGDFPEAQVKLDYLGSSGNLSGFDRFGRIADQLWEHYHLASGDEVVDGTVDEYTYAYDRAGNVTGKTNALDAALSELYGYNNLDALTAVKDSSNNVKQSWTLDSLGNWTNFNDGTATDAKTFNAANETATTTASVTPTYDAAGNAIATAQPGDATTALDCVYEGNSGDSIRNSDSAFFCPISIASPACRFSVNESPDGTTDRLRARARVADSLAIGVPHERVSTWRETLLRLRRPDRRAIGATRCKCIPLADRPRKKSPANFCS